MSRTYDLLSESLREIIDDIKKTGGKNLKRRVVEKPTSKEYKVEKIISSQYKVSSSEYESAQV